MSWRFLRRVQWSTLRSLVGVESVVMEAIQITSQKLKREWARVPQSPLRAHPHNPRTSLKAPSSKDPQQLSKVPPGSYTFYP